MESLNMAGDHSIPPPIEWAQRNDKLYLTINVEDLKDTKIELQESKLVFSGTGGHERKHYAVTLEFFKEIDIGESRYVVLDRNCPMVIKKKEEGPYWPHLLKEKKKPHFLKTDFSKWKDEDDSDFEGGDDMQLEDMMKQMGNFNTNDTPLPDEEEDSDDEDLPDLE